MKNLKNCFLICVLLFLFAGCMESALIEDPVLDALVETITALTVANTVSTPVNPYATPIGIGLAGLVAMLEALRRKERSARKFAENNNHVQDKTRITDVSKFTPN